MTVATLMTQTGTGKRKELARGGAYVAAYLAAKPGVISNIDLVLENYRLELGGADAIRLGTQLLSAGQDDALVQAGGTRTRRGVDSLAYYPTQEGLTRLLAAVVDVLLMLEDSPDRKARADVTAELHAAYNAVHGRT